MPKSFFGTYNKFDPLFFFRHYLPFFFSFGDQIYMLVCWYYTSNEQHSNILVSCSFMMCWCFGRVSRAPIFWLFTSRFPADYRMKNEMLARGPGENVSPAKARKTSMVVRCFYLLAAGCLMPTLAAPLLLLCWWCSGAGTQYAAISSQLKKTQIHIFIYTIGVSTELMRRLSRRMEMR